MSKKLLQQSKSIEIRTQPRDERVVHLNPTPIYKQAKTTTNLAAPLLIITISLVLFILAYSGPAVGNILAYLIIPAIGVFPGLLVGERFGKWAGWLAGALLVAVLTPVYGSNVIAGSISLFTSLQQVSQGILLFFGGLCLVLGIVFLAMGRRRG